MPGEFSQTEEVLNVIVGGLEGEGGGRERLPNEILIIKTS